MYEMYMQVGNRYPKESTILDERTCLFPSVCQSAISGVEREGVSKMLGYTTNKMQAHYGI
jgi:hypothetical protein